MPAPNRKLPPNGKSLNIQVIGRQFVWQYVYPGASEPDGLGRPYSYEEMVVPTNTTVTLDIVSQDVVHSWWIPKLGGKFQAVPGYHNYTWFKIHKPGVYTRPVRRPLRARARAHDRHRQGRSAGAVRSVAGLPEEADRRSQRRAGRTREARQADRRRTGRKP